MGQSQSHRRNQTQAATTLNNGQSGGGGGGSGLEDFNLTPVKYKKSKKCSPAKVKSCLRTFFAHLFSHIGLCVLIVSYAIAGALLFEKLEAEHEQVQKVRNKKTWETNFTLIRKKYVDELWNITEQFNVLYEMNWTSAVEKELKKFEEKVATTAKQEGYHANSNTNGSDILWNFTGALLYSVSIITTIGYGNIAPSTASGKILTMLYAVLGIPLMLLWLSNIGTLMANTFKFAYSHACCPSSSRSSRSVHNKRPASKAEPSATQVKYSVSAMTCKTLVVQKHLNEQGQRPLSKREQRAALRSLDPSAKQVLMECAEYNVNMDQDERSRRILHQLHSDATYEDSHLQPGGFDDESSDEIESVVDLRGLPPGNDTNLRANGGGSVVGISVGSMGVEGTPSKVPLLFQKNGGMEGGPDLVEVEALEDCASYRSASPADDQTSLSQQRVPISLVLIFVVIYILGGATVFSAWEEWGFLESAYFCFITLSTIGLGDFVPGRSLQKAGTEEGHAQLIVCCLYLVLGLAIIAMSFNLVQEEVAAKVKDLARHIGIIKDNPDH